MSFFAYDHAQQALIFLDGAGKVSGGVHAKTLRTLGFQADDANFRAGLPRADKPQITLARNLPPRR